MKITEEQLRRIIKKSLLNEISWSNLKDNDYAISIQDLFSTIISNGVQNVLDEIDEYVDEHNISNEVSQNKTYRRVYSMLQEILNITERKEAQSTNLNRLTDDKFKQETGYDSEFDYIKQHLEPMLNDMGELLPNAQPSEFDKYYLENYY